LVYVLQEVRAIGSGESDFLIGDGGVMSAKTSRQDWTTACDAAAQRLEHWIMVLNRTPPLLDYSMRYHCWMYDELM